MTDPSGIEALFTPLELEQLRGQSRTGALGRYFVAWRDPEGELRLLYSAQARQDALHACAAPNILYGGQAGGGKSHALRWHGFINCLQHAGLKVLLLRRQFTDLEQSHLLKLPEELPIRGEGRIATYNEAKHRLIFPHQDGPDSVFVFGHCKDERALGNYLSSEWDIILVDEASLFTPRMLRMLRTRLRTKNRRIRPQFVCGTNPGGESHLWLLQRFIKKNPPKEEARGYDPALWAFIPSALEDNQYLDAEEYDAQFSELSEAEYKAYRLGDWESFAGQYFTEWSRAVHTIPSSRFELEDWHEVMGGMDWGYAPGVGVVLWGAFDHYGRGTVYQELIFRESTAKEVARMIWHRCRTPAERRMIIHGDPAMRIPQQAAGGVSIMEEINTALAQLAEEAGWPDAPQVIAANNDRMNGWHRVHQYLKPVRQQPETGALGPWLRVVVDEAQTWGDDEPRGCPYLAETLPAQVHDDKMNGDMKKGATDHACDTLRYLVIAREPIAELPLERRPQVPHHQRVQHRNQRLMQKYLANVARQEQDATEAASGELLEESYFTRTESDEDDATSSDIASLWG